MAEAIGVFDKSVSKWERGINLPESSLFIPLCECLEIQVQELLLGEYLSQEDLLKESDRLIVELAPKKDDISFYEFLLFFITLPISMWIVVSFIFFLFGYQNGIIVSVMSFIFIFGLLKAIENIVYQKRYFVYFVITSMNFF